MLQDLINIITVMPTFVLVIMIIIYVIGMFVVVYDQTTEYGDSYDTTNIFGAPFYGVHTSNRDATTKDIWFAMVWPPIALWIVTQAVVTFLNALLILPCLLVGFKYKDTKMYRLFKLM